MWRSRGGGGWRKKNAKTERLMCALWSPKSAYRDTMRRSRGGVECANKNPRCQVYVCSALFKVTNLSSDGEERRWLLEDENLQGQRTMCALGSSNLECCYPMWRRGGGGWRKKNAKTERRMCALRISNFPHKDPMRRSGGGRTGLPGIKDKNWGMMGRCGVCGRKFQDNHFDVKRGED